MVEFEVEGEEEKKKNRRRVEGRKEGRICCDLGDSHKNAKLFSTWVSIVN